jgi:asparagine synthase (glutamine-hydrolysing)
LLGYETVEKRGILDPQVVGRLVEDHRTRRADHTDQLMALISLELWCRLFLDAGSVGDVSDWLTDA